MLCLFMSTLCTFCSKFEQRRTFDQTSEPIRCPGCGEIAKPVHSLPNLARTPKVIIEAKTRSERSAENQRVVDGTNRRSGVSSAKQYRTHGRPLENACGDPAFSRHWSPVIWIPNLSKAQVPRT